MKKKLVTRSIVPNLLTLANLFSGFIAIINASEGKYNEAAIFVLVAAIFDMLDGVMARLIHSTSEFGVELDSLCDAVSFGVAPSYVLYKVYFYQLNEIGVLLAALPALCGVVRLARFNVQLTSLEDKKYFRGLPIPSSALTILSYIVFIHLGDFLPAEYKGAAITLVTLLTSGAMVSSVKFDNLPRPTKRSITQRPVFFALFTVGLIAAVVSAGKLVFPIMLVYIVGSAIRHFIMWIKHIKKAEEEFVPDTSKTN